MRTGQSAGHSEEKPRGTFTNGRGQTVHALTLADLENHDPGAKESGTNWRFLCPLSSPECVAHQNPKTDRDFSLNPQTGLWKCHRCKAEGKLTERWEPREPRGNGGQAAKAEAFRRRMMGGIGTKPSDKAKTAAVAPATGATAGGANESAYDWRARMGNRISLRGTAGAAYLEGRGLPADFCHKAGVRFAVNFGSGGQAKPGRVAWAGGPAVLFCVRDADGRSVAGQGRFIAPRENMSARLTFGPKGGAFLLRRARSLARPS